MFKLKSAGFKLKQLFAWKPANLATPTRSTALPQSLIDWHFTQRPALSSCYRVGVGGWQDRT